MTEETRTDAPASTSVWMKLAYGFIVLMWVFAAVAAVYFTFFSRSHSRESGRGELRNTLPRSKRQCG